MLSTCFYPSPIGPLAITEEDGFLCSIEFGTSTFRGAAHRETPVTAEAYAQIRTYFEGTRRTFSLPLRPHGTAFQKEVWDALRTIPYGETCSYGELAFMAGRPGAARAVGMAVNRAPIALVIPCHRSIGADGSLKGDGGWPELQRKLLDLEQGMRPFGEWEADSTEL